MSDALDQEEEADINGETQPLSDETRVECVTDISSNIAVISSEPHFSSLQESNDNPAHSSTGSAVDTTASTQVVGTKGEAAESVRGSISSNSSSSSSGSDSDSDSSSSASDSSACSCAECHAKEEGGAGTSSATHRKTLSPEKHKKTSLVGGDGSKVSETVESETALRTLHKVSASAYCNYNIHYSFACDFFLV